jgi:hypothetical protein
VKVDWGDGTPAETHTVKPEGRMFEFPHRYLDDRGSAQVSVTVTDDGGATATASRPALVLNARPSALSLKALSDVTEGAVVAYAIEFTDPGERDTHTVTVDWGDGQPSSKVNLEAGRRRVEFSHRYIKDGTFTIRPVITDDDGGSVTTSMQRFVANVAPDLVANVDRASIVAGKSVTLSGRAQDAGVYDKKTLTVDWGVGSPQTVDLGPGGDFRLLRRFLEPGQYTIKLKASDDGWAETHASIPITVTAA